MLLFQALITLLTTCCLLKVQWRPNTLWEEETETLTNSKWIRCHVSRVKYIIVKWTVVTQRNVLGFRKTPLAVSYTASLSSLPHILYCDCSIDYLKRIGSWHQCCLVKPANTTMTDSFYADEQPIMCPGLFSECFRFMASSSCWMLTWISCTHFSGWIVSEGDFLNWDFYLSTEKPTDKVVLVSTLLPWVSSGIENSSLICQALTFSPRRTSARSTLYAKMCEVKLDSPMELIPGNQSLQPSSDFPFYSNQTPCFCGSLWLL